MDNSDFLRPAKPEINRALRDREMSALESGPRRPPSGLRVPGRSIPWPPGEGGKEDPKMEFKINGREPKSGDLIEVKDSGYKKIVTRRVVVVGKAGFSVCSDDDFQSAVEEGKCPEGTRYFPWGTNEVIGFAEPPGMAYGPELDREKILRGGTPFHDITRALADDRKDASFRESNRLHDDFEALGKAPAMWAVRLGSTRCSPCPTFATFSEFGDAAQAAAAITDAEVVFNPERDVWDRRRLKMSDDVKKDGKPSERHSWILDNDTGNWSPTRLSCSPNMDVEILGNSDEENLDESYAGAKLLQLGKIVFNHTRENLGIQHFAVSEADWERRESRAFEAADEAVKRFYEKHDPEESDMADANNVAIGNDDRTCDQVMEGDKASSLARASRAVLANPQDSDLLKITTTVNDAGKVKMVSLHIPAKLDPESFKEMKETVHSILEVYEARITGRKCA